MGAATLKVVLCCMFPISLPADTLPRGANWESGEEVSDIPRTFRWGVQRPNLLRYNRVEGFSIGVRAQFRPQSALGPISVTSTARLGLAELEAGLHQRNDTGEDHFQRIS